MLYLSIREEKVELKMKLFYIYVRGVLLQQIELRGGMEYIYRKTNGSILS